MRPEHPNPDVTSRAALEGLGLAIWVRASSGDLTLAEPIPEWVERIWPSVVAHEPQKIVDASPFLENFLIDAAACWSAKTGRVRSGPWVEYDRQGREVHLEATAFTGAGRALLLVERLGEEFQATRSIIQKARETLMAYQRLAQPRPPELAISLGRMRDVYPDYSRCGFLIMRFGSAKPYARIVATIEATARTHGLHILRADMHAFHGDLLSNVKTYLHGCSFGVAVYERIETEEHNANIGLEVGYLMALNKPVLLLKDRTLPQLQADLGGRLYKAFDPFDPESTIPEQLTKWFEDNGIIIPSERGASRE
jgi:hypothetical protein